METVEKQKRQTSLSRLGIPINYGCVQREPQQEVEMIPLFVEVNRQENLGFVIIKGSVNTYPDMFVERLIKKHGRIIAENLPLELELRTSDFNHPFLPNLIVVVMYDDSHGAFEEKLDEVNGELVVLSEYVPALKEAALALVKTETVHRFEYYKGWDTAENEIKLLFDWLKDRIDATELSFFPKKNQIAIRSDTASLVSVEFRKDGLFILLDTDAKLSGTEPTERCGISRRIKRCSTNADVDAAMKYIIELYSK